MTPQEAFDTLALQRLSYLYSDAIDTGAFEMLDQVFTPDARIDYVAAGGIAGSYPEVRAWLAERLALFGRAHHFATNHLYSFAGDTATGKVMVINPMGWPKATAGPDSRSVMFFMAWYRDRYLRTPDGWRIVERIEEPWMAYNLPEALPD